MKCVFNFNEYKCNWVCISITAVTLLVLFSVAQQAKAQPIIEKGIINLREYNFRTQDPVMLDGNWEFYWRELLTSDELKAKEVKNYRSFTQLWNSGLEPSGYATYRLTILLPKSYPSLSLEIPDFYSSYKLYCNGKLIAQNGRVATSKKNYIPKWIPQTILFDVNKSDEVELILHIANFHHQRGGASQSIILGESTKLAQSRENKLAYAYILTGTLLMGGFFFLGLYLFGKHEKAILYFAIFCLVYSYRIIGFGIYPLHYLLPEIPWVLTLRLEYITLFLSGLFFGIYTLHLYPKETSRRLIEILSWISIVFVTAAILLPPALFTKLVLPYFIILITYIIYAFWIYVRAVVNKRDGAQFALASTGVVFFVFLYEMMVYLGFFTSSLLFNALGYIFFFFFQSLVLSYRFAISLKRATSKAEAASKAKSQFLSTMSHEIRTPLNAVIGLSELLKDTSLNAKQTDFINTIKLSGENLLSIINNILDYSKIESSKIEIDESEFEAREIIENALEVVAPLNVNSALELIYDIDDSVSSSIISDSVKLQQILINLINNAIKFTEKGEIFLQISMQDDQEKENAAKLVVSVKDTGIGISEKDMQKLFQSFSQVDASTTRKYGGTGLGLTISKRLIEALGGTIEVHSEPEKGTTFKFFIKVKKGTSIKKAYHSSALEGKKVLVIDDNTTNLKIIHHQSKQQKLDLVTSTDPNYIINNLEKLGNFDFIILDMQMPEQDGVDLAKKIRSKWSKDKLPLVLMSSIYALNSKHHKDLFNLHLSKPVKQSQLFRELEKLFVRDVHTTHSDPVETQEEVKPLKILVAEDNIFNQKVAFRLLEKLGYNPVIVENGLEAFNMVVKGSYDLIFMDVEMPVMDGIEATKKIMEETNNPIPIIAMTANAMPEDKKRCMDAGMNDFVPKPITIHLLKEAIERWAPES